MRKVLPRKEYRLLKNRKSARKSRKRRKAELSSLREEIRALKQENQRLRKLVDDDGSDVKPSKRKAAGQKAKNLRATGTIDTPTP